MLGSDPLRRWVGHAVHGAPAVKDRHHLTDDEERALLDYFSARAAT